MQAKPLDHLRSALFNLLAGAWTLLLMLAILPVGPFLGADGMRRYARFWMRGLQALLRLVVGLSYEVRGLENLPDRPVIIASKHQSAWETVFFHLVRVDTVIGLKHELTRIPLFGWYLMIARNIRIDRGGAAKALRSLTEGARRAVAEGCSILIFPEGTRVAPGEQPPLKSGFAGLYSHLKLPVVPVAVDSGRLWPRNSFLKWAGIVTVRFGEPIPPGLPRAEIEARVHAAINALDI